MTEASVQVAVRLRPMSERELSRDTLPVVEGRTRSLPLVSFTRRPMAAEATLS